MRLAYFYFESKLPKGKNGKVKKEDESKKTKIAKD
jgi:hypothetical protein